jgi:hypothetical protein
MIKITKEAAQSMIHLLHHVKLEIPIDDDEIDAGITTLQAAIDVPTELHAISQPMTCIWTQYDDGVYETECGEAFVFNDGGPAENNAIYCYHCGRKLEVQL